MALAVMGSGQPALLYIVPFTLGTTVVIGWLRKELRQLWTGQPVSHDDQLNFSSLHLFLSHNGELVRPTNYVYIIRIGSSVYLFIIEVVLKYTHKQKRKNRKEICSVYLNFLVSAYFALMFSDANFVAP